MVDWPCCGRVTGCASTCASGPRTCSSPDEELAARRAALAATLADGGLAYVPASQTPWQEIQRGMVGQLDRGMVLKPAVKYQDIAHGPHSVPRDNH